MNRSPIEPTDAAFVVALESLQAALWPCERTAAMQLAAAQRNLATARASSPAIIAAYDDVTDPEREYAAWVELMIEGEQQAQHSARVSMRANRRYRKAHRGEDRWATPTDEAIYRASIHRAVVAITAMLDGDPETAAAAREDVMRRWPADDVDAGIAFVLNYRAAEA